MRSHPTAGSAGSVETRLARAGGASSDPERSGPVEPLPASDTRWVTAVALVALGFTALVLISPSLSFAYPLPYASAFVACMASVTALVCAVLLFKRHRRTGSAIDLLIALALSITACLEAVMPMVGQIDAWTATVALVSRFAGHALVAIVFCLAAWWPWRPLGDRWSNARFSAVVLGAALLAVLIGVVAAGGSPRAIPGGVETSGGDGLIHQHWLLALRLPGVVLLAAAAVGFARRARDERDGLFTWVAMATVLFCVACFHDFVYPSLHTDWLTTADVLRLTAQEVLMIGVLFEMGGWWRRRAADAAERERRRVARDLHDGLAQDLAFLSTQSMLVGRSGNADAESLRLLVAAAEKALEDTRAAIEDLTSSADHRLDRAITATGCDIAERFGCEIDFDLVEIETDRRTSSELTKLAGEAILNAVRHASSRRVDVELRRAPGGIALSIADDGHGIDWDAPTHGFGLTSMQERAARLHGECTIESRSGHGTVVRVQVPTP